MSATLATPLSAAVITAEQVDVEFVLSRNEYGLCNYSEHQFGHVPGMSTYDPARAESGQAGWEAYSSLRERVDAYLRERLLEAVGAWDATARYEQVRSEAKARGCLSHYDTPVAKGDRWGAINERIAGGGTGLSFVSCVGHGGYLVSIARELGIPEVFRLGRAYEEDCAWAVVGLFYPEAVARSQVVKASSVEDVRSEAVESVLWWFRDKVVEFLGVSASDVASALG